MLTTQISRSEALPESDEVRHLELVLQSKCFERAPRLRSLLHYLWDYRKSDISEYAIAVDALERSPDFDPKTDATVRVQIARLRMFLRKYYATEGHEASTWVTIPLGTHEVHLVEVTDQNDPGPDPVPHTDAAPPISVPLQPAANVSSDVRRPGWLLIRVLVAVVALLCLSVGRLLWLVSHHNDTAVRSAPGTELSLFWKNFTDNGRATRIVLPTPVFFSWHYGSGANTLVARDLSINDGGRMADSIPLADVERRYGKPEVWQNYTFASDTFAALELVRYLDTSGIQTSISSSVASPNAIVGYENIVAFGTTSSLSAYQADLDRLSFKLGLYERFVVDKHLPSGSPVQFSLQQESRSRIVMPGIIAVLPHGNSGGRILLVQGAQTAALISYLTSKSGLAELLQAQAKAGNPTYFEAVLLSEVTDENPIQSRLVAFRTFNP